jgi:signal recognition particle subunit SRP19
MPDHFYVYPAYLTSGTPRAQGRRIPSDVAVPEAPVEAIVRAARALGYDAVAEAEKQYPRQSHLYAGRVKVTKRGAVPKARFLLDLAAELRRAPSAGGKT